MKTGNNCIQVRCSWVQFRPS